ALKIDGRKSDSDEDYFLLSDENKVPDANAKLHLKNKFLQENKSKAKELSYDNQAFRKIKSNIDNNDKYDEVNTKSTPLTDGMHYTEDGKTRYRILKGKALYTHNLYTYKNSIGIWQKLFIPAEEEEVTGMNEGVLNVTINNDTYIIEIKNSKVIGITNKSLQKRVLHTIAYIVLLFITIFFYLNYFE
ncbi:MAG: hypothetical protein JJU35_15185, partial [Balneolales bacterium]|nr:hypothetical protein [Balneolales bacterium]